MVNRVKVKLPKDTAFSKMVAQAQGEVSNGHPEVIPYLDRYLDMTDATESKIEIEDFSRPPRVKERFSPSVDCMRCRRALFFDFHPDYQADRHVDAKLRRVFNVGSATHALIQAWFKAMSELDGFPKLVGNEARMWMPELRMSGYIDSILDFPGWGEVPIEIKTINSYGFGRLKEPKAEHRWQIGCYLMAEDAPGGILLYINKDTQELKEFWVEQMDMQPILMRWQTVTDALEGGSVNLLPPECQPGSRREKWCEWSDVCRKCSQGL